MKYTFEESDIVEGLKFEIQSVFVLINLGTKFADISELQNMFLLWNLTNNCSHGVMHEKALVEWINNADAIPVITETNIIG